MSPQAVATMSDEELARWMAGEVLPVVVPERVHGTRHGYIGWACRCARCLDAETVAKLSRARRNAPTPADKARQVAYFEARHPELLEAERLVEELRQ